MNIAKLTPVIGALLGIVLCPGTRCFGQITEYPVPTTNSGPSAITLGPDGAMWFVETRSQFALGRISTAGLVSEFPVAGTGSNSYTPVGPVGLATGPDGNLWLCYSVAIDGQIGLTSIISQMSPGGELIANYQPTTISQLGGITAGPDGALWFTETGSGRIGRITTSGQITEYPVPTPGSQPESITAGPDGALWFTDSSIGQIGRITTAHVFSAFALTNAFANNRATSIVSGSDGALWFTAPANDGALGPAFIGRITTDGVFATPFQVPQANSYPETITTGPDGNIWFTDDVNNQIDSLTTDGVFTQYNVPSASSGPYGIAPGPDSAIWFTEQNGARIGRLGFFAITTTSLPPGLTGTPYAGTLSLRAGATGTGWSISAGVLPDGLSLNSATGLIAGTPITVGTFTFTVQISDSSSHSATRVLTIVITGLPSFAESPIPTAGSSPGPITLGSDGALWFTEAGSQAKIGRVDTTKTFTEYPITQLTGAATFGGITSGPDGDLWFTCWQSTASYIGHITLSGTVTLFPTATYSSLGAIAAAPDGALWFTEQSANRIGRATTNGSLTEFPITTAQSQPFGITLGPDGALWFTESATAQIGRVTTAGILTEYSLHSQYSGPGQLTPTSIVAAPDGALWFTILNPSLIGRFTTAGVFTYFASAPGSTPASIVSATDGSLWFTDTALNQIDSITPGGAITQHTIPTGGSMPAFLAVGPSSDLWFTEQQGNNVGRLLINTTIREFPDPSPNSNPGPITSGPDGALWFGEQGPPLQIARATISGSILEFVVPAAAGGGIAGNQIGGITTGPDGNIWFTVSNTAGNSFIAGITPAGTMLPAYAPIVPSTLQAIASGPDGALWFAAGSSNQIGRIAISGSVIEYSIPTSGSSPYGIVLGPDQALWFTELNANKIGRITALGAITEYPLPSGMQGPLTISAGTGNNLYFALSDGQIGQITTAGVISPFTALSAPSAFGIALGPDGKEWFTDPRNNQIHQLGGAQYAIPTADSLPYSMALGSDGALWFTESGTGKIGRLGIPVIASATLPAGVVSAPYSATAMAKGGTAPYTWSIATGSLPPGLSLSQSTGVISGTPTTPGSYAFSIAVVDAGQPQPVSSSQALSIVISAQVGPPPGALAIITTTLPTGTVGTPYSLTFAAQGGIAPYTWTGTGLPAGLALTSAGVLSGTPTATGTYSILLQLADSSSSALTAAQTFSFVVNAFAISTASAPSGTVGAAYSTALAAQGGTGPYSWTATGLPPGITLSAAGVLSGTPTTPGSYSLVLQVTDSSSPVLTATQTLAFTIFAASGSTGSTPGSPGSPGAPSSPGAPTGPAVSVTGLPATQQPGIPITDAGLQLATASATDFTGTVSLAFTSIAAGLPTPYANPGVCFTTLSSCAATPQITFAFTIPAGSTVLSLPQIQPGTVEGIVTVTVTPAGQSPVISSFAVPSLVPVIEANSVQITNVTNSGFVVELVASSTPRDLKTATFTFNAAPGAQLTGASTFTVDVSALLSGWYSSSEGQNYGSLFSLRAPFTNSGNSSAIGSVSVTLTNSIGSSAPLTGTQ